MYKEGPQPDFPFCNMRQKHIWDVLEVARYVLDLSAAAWRNVRFSRQLQEGYATESSRSTPRSDHILHTLALARNILIGLQVDTSLLIDGLLYSQSAEFSVGKPARQWADPCMANHSSTMHCMLRKDERFSSCNCSHKVLVVLKYPGQLNILEQRPLAPDVVHIPSTYWDMHWWSRRRRRPTGTSVK